MREGEYRHYGNKQNTKSNASSRLLLKESLWCVDQKQETLTDEYVFSEVATKLRIKQPNMANCREFRNALVGEWCRESEINIKFSATYVHESNGRIERLNKTTREILKRTKGPHNKPEKCKRSVQEQAI
ncbi:hypothetical protein CDIK_0738 [Cucumispora dikerogammari]|nr:hypothetical protein CDIK_0738 [Cucumispora dikerogammari]